MKSAPSLTILVTLLFTSSGCSLWQTSNSPAELTSLRSSVDSDPLQATIAARDSNSVVLLVHGTRSAPRIIPLPTDGKPVFVSDLLRQSGLTQEFAQMQATLHRNSTDAISGVRMGIRFANKSNAVLPEHDYQLLPGDRIEVAEEESSPFASLSDMLSPPRGRKFMFMF